MRTPSIELLFAIIARSLDRNAAIPQDKLAMRTKTTVCIDSDLLRAVKVAAARTGKKEYAIFEDALRRYLGLELLRRVPPRRSEEPDEDEALDLAYRELREAKR